MEGSKNDVPHSSVVRYQQIYGVYTMRAGTTDGTLRGRRSHIFVRPHPFGRLSGCRLNWRAAGGPGLLLLSSSAGGAAYRSLSRNSTRYCLLDIGERAWSSAACSSANAPTSAAAWTSPP